MYVERLELADFRSYTRARLDLGPGVEVLVGANAQGKTNLLEALHYLATGASHRVGNDAPLVRVGADAAVIRAVVRADGASVSARAVTVEVEVRPSGRNRAKVNGQAQARVRDAFGRLRGVLFAPEDLQLVVGNATQRRRFLDDLLAQRRPAYLAARQDYDRVLRQRNALLRTARPRPSAAPPDPSLQTWTQALIAAGATLTAARIAAVNALAAPTVEAYRMLAAPVPGSPSAPQSSASQPAVSPTLAYQLSTGRRVAACPGASIPDPGVLAQELQASLARLAAAELERGVTLVGPHRDDLYLGVGELPAKGFASHGECWSLALALRLAARNVLGESGEAPIVMLDDVFAALDESRRARLAEQCTAFDQVLVTAAVAEDVPLSGRRHLVHGGSVTSPAAAQHGAGGVTR
ncbi:MAG: DNA replication/repair protein RecF [Actinomycetota bacterium]|nr:DNA replication/repair protein RecF [Actinomycetota bacterium]